MGSTCQACSDGDRNNFFEGYNIDSQPKKSRRSIESLSQESFHTVGGATAVTPESSGSNILNKRAMFESMSKKNGQNNNNVKSGNSGKKYKWQVKDPTVVKDKPIINKKPSLSHGTGSHSINYEPLCDDCGAHFHIMDDPSIQYDGKGITCSKCKRKGSNELLSDDFYYQCSDCQMTELCTQCFHDLKAKKREEMNGVTPKMIRQESRKNLKSIKDRTQAYHSDLQGIAEKHDDKIQEIKNQRGHQSISKMDETEKNKIKANFAKKLNQQLTGGIDTTAAQYGATNSYDDENNDNKSSRLSRNSGGGNNGGGSGSGSGPQAGRISIETREGRQVSGSVAQILNDATVDNANEIVTQMGFIQKQESRASKSQSQSQSQSQSESNEETKIFNMNNYSKLNTLQSSDKTKMYDIISHYIAKSNEIRIAQLCNCGIDDDFVTVLMEKLKDSSMNDANFGLQEIWLENNRIRDKGFEAIAEFINVDKHVKVFKLAANRADISTGVLNKLVDAIENNDTIVKFIFEGWRLQQHKDRIAKAMRNNSEKARKARLQQKK